ncbi:hypothetical protein SAMN04489751_3857 [Brevibacterium sandarakinum]|uniref:Uncharacterized protein n=1 Tax=Brevibacterium sandarakinum TaxID=629680 RepID=A0A1H1XWD3_BRESA|nr:hypothetical protein SAMN04489751_3857 [Brevibacterium sandarakinum]
MRLRHDRESEQSWQLCAGVRPNGDTRARSSQLWENGPKTGVHSRMIVSSITPIDA